MNVLILHGIMGSAGENWGQWLSDQLEARAYTLTMPTLPNPDHPDRTEWLNVITKLMTKLGSDTIIVGHSIGVTSALDYLENTNVPIKGLISVSGIFDEYGLELNRYFLKVRSIDADKVKKNMGKAFAFYGDDDPYVPQDSLQLLADKLNVKPVILSKGGHLNATAGFTEFPQLLDTILSI